MDSSERQDAERVLRRLFLGTLVHGLLFCAGPGAPFIVFASLHPREHEYNGNITLTIESNWFPYKHLPERLPAAANEMPERDEEEQLMSVCSLRRQMVTGVRLGQTIPHLLLTLESGITIFVNGHHDLYESWQVANDDCEAMVIACPGDNIAAFFPPCRDFL